MDWTCTHCLKIFSLNKTQDWRRRTKDAAMFWCSRSCTASWKHQQPTLRNAIAAANARRADAFREESIHRATHRNPMRDPATRAKVSEALRRIGHKPFLHGGNGVGPTKPQLLLADALGWPMEVCIPGRPRSNGVRSTYRLDLASESLKIAIEVDGASHRTSKQQQIDRHKEKVLLASGWSVLRFTNQQVMDHLEACVLVVLYTTSKLNGTTTTLWPAR